MSAPLGRAKSGGRGFEPRNRWRRRQHNSKSGSRPSTAPSSIRALPNPRALSVDWLHPNSGSGTRACLALTHSHHFREDSASAMKWHRSTSRIPAGAQVDVAAFLDAAVRYLEREPPVRLAQDLGAERTVGPRNRRPPRTHERAQEGARRAPANTNGIPGAAVDQQAVTDFGGGGGGWQYVDQVIALSSRQGRNDLHLGGPLQNGGIGAQADPEPYSPGDGKGDWVWAKSAVNTCRHARALQLHIARDTGGGQTADGRNASRSRDSARECEVGTRCARCADLGFGAASTSRQDQQERQGR